MNETVKTLAFLVAALASVGAAYYVENPAAEVDTDDFVGTLLNKGIDVAAPRRMKIIKFDRQNSETRQFEVAEVDGVWSIPSKENYPADATQQMAEAATCVIDRKILRVAGRTAESHEQYGVVDPLAPGLNSKSKGVGTHVIMTDADDGKLVDMIVGSKVKDTTNQYYVREANRDFTYVVELDPEKLSTDFADWIEDDLLKLSAFDIRKVFINDYSAELRPMITNQGVQIGVDWRRRGQMTLGYNDDDAKWTAIDLKQYDSEKKDFVETPLAEGEEINQEKLNELRNALDDLLIVDVARKPEGLSNDLKAGTDFLSNEEAIDDLIRKGFAPVGGENEILSSEGEVLVTQRDGVEYVLRFGQLQIQTEGEDEGEAASAASTDPAKVNPDPGADAANLRRYLFVMARFNNDVIEKPQLKELPDLPADDAGEDASASSSEDNADDNADPDAERERIIAERKEIETENQRLLDTYNESIKTGQKKVKDLNARFGDWYYVISNDVYKKIHLSHKDVVKNEDKPAEEDAAAQEDEDPAAGLPQLPAAGATP